SAALCALAVTGEAMAALPAVTVTATTQEAIRFLTGGGEGPGSVLAAEALKGMTGGKIKATAVMVLALVGASGLGYQLTPSVGLVVQEQKQQAVLQTTETPRAENARIDLFGDPLPPGALVRMGTIRLRQPNPRMVFSGEGKSLTSVGADNTVRTWDIA